MRPIGEQNFYEMLEVSRDATPQMIERAHRIARATYDPTSAATYSVLSEEEAAEILRRIEEAYTVLSETRLRREYDARLRREGVADTVQPGPVPLGMRRSRPETSQPTPQIELDLDEPVEPLDGVYDGPVLRRIRMSRGIELEEVAAFTKIGELYLQFIEANRYEDLPAPVYLKGFLGQIAKCLRLEPRAVVYTYMARYKERRAGA